MANRHLTPKCFSSNPNSGNFNNFSKNPEPGYNSQTNLRFKPKVQTYAALNSENHKERMMTLKRNNNGETEIKFPIGNTQFIRETQHLFNRYFPNENMETQPLGQCFDTASTGVPSVAQNSDMNKRFKSDNSFKTKPVPHSVLKPITSNSKGKPIAKKDLLNENSQTENVIDRKVVHLIGYVEHILKWDQMMKNSSISVVYNVLGTFINVINGCYAMEKCIFIKGNTGTVLECSFFEVDRPCPVITKGQFVGCLGQIIGTQKLRLYDIHILEESERNETQRVIFLSQRMTQEINNRK